MKPQIPDLGRESSEMLQAAVLKMRQAEEELQRLTHGQVDAISTLTGETFLLREAQSNLRQSEKDFHQLADSRRAILNALPAHIALIDADGVVQAVNETWRLFAVENAFGGEHFGVGVNYLAVCEKATGDSERDGRNVAAGIRDVTSGRSPHFSYEYPCHSPSQERWFRLMVTPLGADYPTGAVVTHIDITESKVSEVKNRRIARLYQVSSAVNQAIVHAEDLDRLYDDTCRILVEEGELAMAWIGLPDSEGGSLKPSAKHGRWAGYLEDIEISADNTQMGRGPSGTAFRENRVVVCSSIASDLAMQPWRKKALEHGFESSAAFPIRLSGKPMAVISVYSEVPGFFNAEEIRLLTELSDNLSFAVESHHRDALRAQAELSLRASERKFSNAFEYASIGIALVSTEGRFLSVNQALCRLLGYSEPELLRLSFQEITHPEDLEPDLKQARALLAGEIQSYHIEKRYFHKNGQVIWILLSGSLVKDDDGRPLYFIAQIQDITARKETEEALRKSEERFELAALGSKAAIWDWNVLTGECYYAPRYAEMLGYLPGEFPDHIDFFYESIHPDDREWMRAAMEAHFGPERKAVDVEFRMRTKAGDYRWFGGSGQAVYDESGRAFRMAGSTADITERKLAELQLKEALENIRKGAEHLQLLETCISRLNDMLIITEASPVDEPGPAILFVNEAFERITGYSKEETLGRSPRFLQGQGTSQIERQRIREAVRHHKPVRAELINHAKDGSEYWIELDMVPIFSESGQPTHFVAVERDITERKRLEAQLLRVQRMESIGTLAGGIAHDLNNLLAPIMMGIGLLRQCGVPKEMESVVQNIELSAARGTELVKQVLSFARGVEGARIPLQLANVVREVEAIVTNTFPKNISFQHEIPVGLLPVIGDPIQLDQVVLNLCVNARDAMAAKGGGLKISAANVEVDAATASIYPGVSPGRFVLLTVADEGCGIPRDMLDRVFEPFFTTKELGMGTGLGLSTVLGIVKSHGGFVTVSSTLGVGTEFKVYLPAQGVVVPSEALGHDQASLPRGHGEWILVVDDEASILGITKQTLETFGYRVLVAEDGAQAISHFAAHSEEVALVLTDLMMPVMDGPTLIAALRRIKPDIKIIAASGLSPASPASVAVEGVDCFLVKPYSGGQMLGAISELLKARPV